MASENLLKQLSKFQPDLELPLGGRVAQLLDWAAKEVPGSWVPLHVVTKLVMGYKHTPRMGNDEVQRIRRLCSTTVRRVLDRDYNRELLNQTGLGLRATVDSADVLKHKLPQRANRFNAARASLEKTAERVDVKKLPRTKDMEPWREWYEKSIAPAMRALKAANVETKLLPPGDGKEG